MKSYYRYSPSGCMGVICSPDGPTIFDRTGKLAFTTALENVGVWNLRQANEVCKLQYEDAGYPFSERSEVTSLELAADNTTICVGYSTGEVRLFNYVDKSLITTLRGHRSAVSVLSLRSPDHTVLASGGADCHIVLWDLITRTGSARLRGHKDMITALSFLKKDTDNYYLVSASKDTLLKVWDTLAMTCLQTIVGHRSEIWSLAVLPAEDIGAVRVFTGASDDLLRVYKFNTSPTGNKKQEGEGEEEILSYLGCCQRSSSDRCVSLVLNPNRNLLAAQGAGKSVDFFRLLDKQQTKKRMKRRLKRVASKAADDEEEDEVADQKEGQEGLNVAVASLEDEIDFSGTLRSSTKIRSFAFHPQSSSVGEDIALSALVNNSLEMFKVQSGPSGGSQAVAVKTSLIDLPGHRSDVRGICISADDTQLATCSAEAVKVWSVRTGQCIGSCRSDQYALCLAFAPGGRFLLVGTKAGELLVIDVASGESKQTISDAHEAAIWSIAIRPDGAGFSTASADKMVKFWNFEIAADGSLRIAYDRQLVTPSDILCVRYNHSKTPQNLMVAIAQLDHNIRIFFHDSLKLYLTLYGHKLPVLTVDISYDNALLISGSADKTIKIWGMDFGDCHRSLFAHDDSVTAVKFVNKTHFFFSSSKDGAVKYWDADRFEQILLLPGHKGSVWGLEIASDGSSVFSVGADRSIRLWSRQEDLVFVEEERERMLEAQVDKTAAETAQDNAESQVLTSSASAAMPSIESIRSGDQLMETIDNIEQEIPDFMTAISANLSALKGDDDVMTLLQQPCQTAVMLGLSPLRYLLRALRMIKQPDLEAVLMVLPFHYIQRLLVLLVQLARSGLEVELCCRCAIFLILCHQAQIAATDSLAPAIVALRDVVVHAVGSYRFLVGVNLSGLQFMQQTLTEQADDIQATRLMREGGKKNKKRKAGSLNVSDK